MYQRSLVCIALCVLVLTALAGCGKKETAPSEQEHAQAALTEWRQLAEDPKSNIGNQKAAELGLQLAMGGAKDLEPVLAALEDPKSDPALRVLATVTLEPVTQMDEDGSLVINRVKPLVDPSHDATVRACATQLLAAARRQDLRPVLESAASDSDARIKIAALGGLAALGDPSAISQLGSLYNSPQIKPLERDRIAYELCQTPPQMLDMNVLTDALYKVASDSTRLAIVKVLGKYGTPAQIHALEDFTKGVVVSDAVNTAAREAVAAIKDRQNGSGAAAPAVPAEPAATIAPASGTNAPATSQTPPATPAPEAASPAAQENEVEPPAE